MNEPPAQVLYRLMQKKKICPEYTLTYDGTRSQHPTFQFQVTCDGLVKTGTGFSKKEAKHNAAKAMLEEIFSQSDSTQLPVKSIDSPKEFQPDIVPQFPLECADESPKMEMSPKEDLILPEVKQKPSSLNIATALEKVCRQNKLAIPEYKIKKYCKFGTTTFKVDCVLPSYKETATEETLDKAVQEAARKAWAKLQIDWQKPQNIKREEENFDELVNSTEALLQSIAKENHGNEKRKLKSESYEEYSIFDVKEENNSESWENDLYEKSHKKRKLSEVKKQEAGLMKTEFSVEKPEIPLFLNAVEVLNQICIDISLPKPVYECTISYGEFAQYFDVTCTISTFKVITRAQLKNESKYKAAKHMIDRIKSSVEKLKKSKILDLQSEEAKFFVNGTVMGMLETLSDQTDITLSSEEKSIKIEDDDFQENKNKPKNAITTLNELCRNNSLKRPRFDVLEHNIFYSDNYKVSCIVSTFKAESQGKCIEEAKLKSAQKLLGKFTKLQNSYLEQLMKSVKSLDFKNPSRWKSKY